MLKFYLTIKSIFHKITDTMIILSEIILFGITISIFYDVTMRYGFNNPTIWSTEICRYSLIFLTFMGLADLQKRKSNITMDFFYNKFSPNLRKFIDLFNSIFLIIFSGIITVEAYLLVMAAYKYHYYSNALFTIPLVIPYSVVLIGIFMLFIQGLIDIIDAIIDIKNRR